MTENNIFICPRCGNKDEEYIGYFNDLPYCRKCLSFNGREVNSSYTISDNIIFKLDYPLSDKQKRCSDEVYSSLLKHQNVLIHAVTGAGKTELVFNSIAHFLKEGKHVGFATPRKDVVIDLLPRFKNSFLNANIISVYGEHNSLLEGDIILLTTHQLYRYPNYFDLLILDEIDAFPYRGNDLLKSFFRKSIRGNYVLLSATPSDEDIAEIKKDNGTVIELFERYHHGNLIVPTFIKGNKIKQFFSIFKLLRLFLKQNKPVFIFSPTIKEGKILFSFLSFFFKNGQFVSSKEEERAINIDKFKHKLFAYLVTTSILERGVTVKDLQVIVYHADSKLFTASALVQIAGRVGRKIDATGGEVYFLGNEKNKSIPDSIKEIESYNRKKNNLR